MTRPQRRSKPWRMLSTVLAQTKMAGEFQGHQLFSQFSIKDCQWKPPSGNSFGTPLTPESFFSSFCSHLHLINYHLTSLCPRDSFFDFSRQEPCNNGVFGGQLGLDETIGLRPSWWDNAVIEETPKVCALSILSLSLTPPTSCLPCSYKEILWAYNEKAPYATQRERFNRSQPCPYLDLRLPASRSVRKSFSVIQPSTLWYFVMAAWNRRFPWHFI